MAEVGIAETFPWVSRAKSIPFYVGSVRFEFLPLLKPLWLTRGQSHQHRQRAGQQKGFHLFSRFDEEMSRVKFRYFRNFDPI